MDFLEREVPVRFWIVAAALLALLAVAQIVRAKLRSAAERWRLERQSDRALAAEAWAAELLCEAGFEIIGAQVRTSYCLRVDERPGPSPFAPTTWSVAAARASSPR